MTTLATTVVITEDETGAILLDQRTGRYWAMNDTGARVLRRLLDGGTTEDAAAELSANYAHADLTRVVRDTRALLDQLQTAGLVTS
jgi:hypothetical protein